LLWLLRWSVDAAFPLLFLHVHPPVTDWPLSTGIHIGLQGWTSVLHWKFEYPVSLPCLRLLSSSTHCTKVIVPSQIHYTGWRQVPWRTLSSSSVISIIPWCNFLFYFSCLPLSDIIWGLLDLRLFLLRPTIMRPWMPSPQRSPILFALPLKIMGKAMSKAISRVMSKERNKGRLLLDNGSGI